MDMIRLRMRDLIYLDALRHAVDSTMKRYPYFCVELQKKEEQYIFAENHRPVVITGAYEVLRTLLYYYCSERYQIKLNDEGMYQL